MQMSEAERKRYSYFEREESSHFFIKSSEPQTLAYGCADSPVGWLAWVMDIFQQGTDNNGDFLTVVDRDAFLTDVTLYWVTNTAGSSMRIYREYRLTGEGSEPQPRMTVPCNIPECRRADTSRLWNSPVSCLTIYGSSLMRWDDLTSNDADHQPCRIRHQTKDIMPFPPRCAPLRIVESELQSHSNEREDG